MAQLSATITADVTGYKKAIDDARKTLAVFTKEESATAQTMRQVYDVSQDQVKVFRKSVDALEKATNGTKSNKAAAIALAKEIEKLKMQWSNLSDTAKKSAFGQQMANSMREAETRMKGLQAEMAATNRGISAAANATGAMSTGLSILGTALYSFGGPAAIATAAVKTLKDTLLSSESNIDSWGRMVQGAETTYLHFVNALRTMNFSDFSISQAFSQGRNAYNAADELDTFGGVNAAYVQQLYTRLASLRAKKADGEKIDKTEIKALEKEFETYYNAKNNRNRRAVWETLQSKTPNIDIYSEPYKNKLEAMFSGKVRGDQIWDNLGDSMSAEDRKKQQRGWESELAKMRKERDKFVKENTSTNIYDMPSISNEEYVKKLDSYDESIASLESKLNDSYANHSAQNLQEYEVAVREAIAEMTKMQADFTELENVKKSLAKLNAKDKQTTTAKTKASTPLVEGSVAYYEDLIRKENEKIKSAVDAGTIATIKDQIAEYQKKIDELLGNAPKYAFKYQFETYKPNKANEVKTEQYDPDQHLSAIKNEISAVGDLSNAWAGVGEAIQSADPSAILSGIANGINQTINSVTQLAKASEQAAQMQRAASLGTMAASEGEALGKGTASASALPYPANLIAIASVVATIAATFASFSGMMKKPKGFAKGGLVYSPTLALVGEGSRTNNANPEVIAPLDKLKGMLADSGSNGAGGDVYFHISGGNLEGVLKKRNIQNSRR